MLRQVFEVRIILFFKDLINIAFGSYEIMDGFLNDFLVILDEFHIKGGMTLEGIFLEHAFTKAMYSKDGRLIKINQGKFKEMFDV